MASPALAFLPQFPTTVPVPPQAQWGSGDTTATSSETRLAATVPSPSPSPFPSSTPSPPPSPSSLFRDPAVPPPAAGQLLENAGYICFSSDPPGSQK